MAPQLVGVADFLVDVQNLMLLRLRQSWRRLGFVYLCALVNNCKCRPSLPCAATALRRCASDVALPTFRFHVESARLPSLEHLLYLAGARCIELWQKTLQSCTGNDDTKRSPLSEESRRSLHVGYVVDGFANLSSVAMQLASQQVPAGRWQWLELP